MKNLSFCSHITIDGPMEEAASFVLTHQLLDKCAWQDYINAFIERKDSHDHKWRGEYFGKQMRGASLMYAYTHSEKLYQTLEWAVRRLLSTQDSLGRISSYTVGEEFTGWDLWSRKYVITGLLHFMDVCPDKMLKEQIMAALIKHLDAIVDRIGPGKIDITQTSEWWDGLNSCTILEPVVDMYRRTGRKSYLDFAAYIIGTGGCRSGNVIQEALSGEKMPWQYPVNKAYELMSFFEGVLSYYEVTGEEQYFTAADRFLEALYQSDITLIGCAGCDHEQLNGARLKQTDHSDTIMQETCVTVTWMRLMARMYRLKGEAKYMDRLEQADFNALYGSLNTCHCQAFSMEQQQWQLPKTFDSYSPLVQNRRGRAIGGFIPFENGRFGSCCDVIASCGVALMPLSAVMTDEEGTLYLNIPFRGTATVSDLGGRETRLRFDADYPSAGSCRILVECPDEAPRHLKLKFRHPGWEKDEMTLSLSPSEASSTVCLRPAGEDGYAEMEGTFRPGTQILWDLPMKLQTHRLNGKTACTFGPLTLALDEAKQEEYLTSLQDSGEAPSLPEVQRLDPAGKEMARFLLSRNGKRLLLTDYVSCGKKWNQPLSRVSVWLSSIKMI